MKKQKYVITPENFLTIKKMLKVMTGAEVARTLGSNACSVSYVKTAVDYEAYKLRVSPPKISGGATEVVNVKVLPGDTLLSAVGAPYEINIDNNKVLEAIYQLEKHLALQDQRFEGFAKTYAWVANNAVLDTNRKKWYR
jgi:hypothetical protein